MAQTEIERAFATLAEALTSSESEMNGEIQTIEEQIEQLKDRIVELKGKQETLSVDRTTIEEMYNKYCPAAESAVEF